MKINFLEKIQDIINCNYKIIANEIVDVIISVELKDQDLKVISYHDRLSKEMDNILSESESNMKEKIQNLKI